MNSIYNTTGEYEACECCGGEAHLTTESMVFLYGAGDNTVELTAQVPVWACDACGERFTADGAEEAQHDAICDHLERLRPSEIRAMRERTGLTQAQFGDLFGFGRASIARWENGTQIPSRSCDQMLREWRDRPVEPPRTVAQVRPKFRTDVSHRESAARAFRLQAA